MTGTARVAAKALKVTVVLDPAAFLEAVPEPAGAAEYPR